MIKKEKLPDLLYPFLIIYNNGGLKLLNFSPNNNNKFSNKAKTLLYNEKNQFIQTFDNIINQIYESYKNENFIFTILQNKNLAILGKIFLKAVITRYAGNLLNSDFRKNLSDFILCIFNSESFLSFDTTNINLTESPYRSFDEFFGTSKNIYFQLANGLIRQESSKITMERIDDIWRVILFPFYFDTQI